MILYFHLAVSRLLIFHGKSVGQTTEWCPSQQFLSMFQKYLSVTPYFLDPQKQQDAADWF